MHKIHFWLSHGPMWFHFGIMSSGYGTLSRYGKGKALTIGRLILILIAVLLTVAWYGVNQNSITRNNSELIGDDGGNQKISSRDEFLRAGEQNLTLTDPKLLDYIREYFLIPPSNLPYKIKKVKKTEYDKRLSEVFKDIVNGFFIECGANDGEFLSSTLELEKQGWSGLLIEAQPEHGERLLKTHRKAWFANVCLSPYKNISEIDFAIGRVMDKRWKNAIGKLLLPDNSNMKLHRNYGKVICIPLVSLLAALNVTHVDYLALDVEGIELKVLNTLPFDDTLTIDYIQVETNHLPEGEPAIRDFLESKGYEFVLRFALDILYKRKT